MTSFRARPQTQRSAAKLLPDSEASSPSPSVASSAGLPATPPFLAKAASPKRDKAVAAATAPEQVPDKEKDRFLAVKKAQAGQLPERKRRK